MPKQKKDTDSTARIPTPSIDLGDAPADTSSPSPEESGDTGTSEPRNQQTTEPSNRRESEPENRGTDEPANYRTNEPSSEDPRSQPTATSPSDGFASAPLTYESMITPKAPINRKKIGVHIDEVTFAASSEAWREMLRIDNNLNKGVVVEAALRVALADFAEKGSDSSLWKMVRRICETES